jgi:hypothetical protein
LNCISVDLRSSRVKFESSWISLIPFKKINMINELNEFIRSVKFVHLSSCEWQAGSDPQSLYRNRLIVIVNKSLRCYHTTFYIKGYSLGTIHAESHIPHDAFDFLKSDNKFWTNCEWDWKGNLHLTLASLSYRTATFLLFTNDLNFELFSRLFL